MRLRFWLLVVDAVVALGGYGSRAYLCALARASDATDWGPPLPAATEEGR